MGKNKPLSHYTSIYFNINWDKRSISIKQKYKLTQYFQKNLSLLIKRGIYEIFWKN